MAFLYLFFQGLNREGEEGRNQGGREAGRAGRGN
jgi:hypothetical protein|tara:strand:+ start:260 stop:361 length:102 start_codon:yes stop_codon:yes gene_type:complete